MNTFKIILVTTIISIISGLALAYVYEASELKTTEQQTKILKSHIFSVLPKARDFKKIELENGTVLYQGLDYHNRQCGYAVIVKGRGFQGNLTLIFGIDSDSRTISGVKILDNSETSQLGARIIENEFLQQFIGLNLDIIHLGNTKNVKTNEIQAISGATISSKAVVNLINSKLDEIEKYLEAING